MVEDFKKALITGGAGFIGSHIAEELVHRGIEARGLSRTWQEKVLGQLKGASVG